MKELNSKLASLGMAILVDESEPADPERTLLECLPLFQEDRKLLSLILAWLDEYGDLLHIERIYALSKTLKPLELAWLGGLASHTAEKYSRFQALVRFVEAKLSSQRRRFPKSELDTLAIKRKGKDPHFEKFGLEIPSIEPASKKKLLTRAHTIDNHPGLRLRLLFGTNWRASIAMELLRKKEQTPYRIAQNLGCNTETVYRNLRSLEEGGAVEILAAVS